MLPDQTYRQAVVRFAPGELLLLCSDGAIEAHSPADQEFGLERLAQLVAAADPGQPDRLLAQIEQALLTHVESVRLPDDLALLAVSRDRD
jgi:serine phosphatase RsbU (regulator of sigma subunit)